MSIYIADVSGSVWIARILTLVSLVVAMLNSYPTSFIVMLATVLTRLSDFSSFSLSKSAFEFSLCELNTRLKIAAVTLLPSVIDTYSSSLMTLKTAYQISTLDYGITQFCIIIFFRCCHDHLLILK